MVITNKSYSNSSTSLNKKNKVMIYFAVVIIIVLINITTIIILAMLLSVDINAVTAVTKWYLTDNVTVRTSHTKNSCVLNQARLMNMCAYVVEVWIVVKQTNKQTESWLELSRVRVRWEGTCCLINRLERTNNNDSINGKERRAKIL